jgi:hypothetical protein
MAASPPAPLAQARRVLTRLGGGLILVWLTGELAIRAVHPRPRLQVIDLTAGDVHEERFGEHVLWRAMKREGSRDTSCSRPGSFDVALAGDSVFHTLPGDAPDADHLLFRLRAALPDACVIDGFEPGYFPSQELAEAQRLHAAHGLDLVLLLVWKPSSDWTRVGDRLYALDFVARGPDGLPASPLPSAVFQPLFRYSALFNYATLATVTRDEDHAPDPARDYLAAIAWAREAGVDLVLVEAVELHRSFADTLKNRRADASIQEYGMPWAPAIQRAAADAGFGYVVLAQSLLEEDYLALRMDDCCHFNSAGHAAIADALAPVIAARRAGLTPP